MTDRPRLAVGGVVLREGARGAEVLLVRRANPPRRGSLTLPGGRVEWGERLADAVRRELREEVGLHVEVGPLVELVELVAESFHYVIADYLCEVAGGELTAASDASEVRWVELPALGELALAHDGPSAEAVRVIHAAFALWTGARAAPSR
jgi:mutator protein MutT